MLDFVNSYARTECDIPTELESISQLFARLKIRVSEISCDEGPSLRCYTVRTLRPIAVAKLRDLPDLLSLELCTASPVRILKNDTDPTCYTLEIPRRVRQAVWFNDLFAHEDPNAAPLSMTLGVEVSGEIYRIDLARAPHVWVSGSTGMGKSVCLYTMLASLCRRNSPEDLKLVLIDPKRVEFSACAALPHLLTPIVTDRDATAQILADLVAEVDRRYERMQKANVRSIADYRRDPSREPMPYIVVMIDEPADLLVDRKGKQAIEHAILCLAQKARAAGIHLVIASQSNAYARISPALLPNFPTRIALKMTTRLDSKRFLGCYGAEQLMPRGDMLCLSPTSQTPIRVQGAFLPESEVEG